MEEAVQLSYDDVDVDVDVEQQPSCFPSPSASTRLARPPCQGLAEDSCSQYNSCTTILDCTDSSTNSTPFVSAPSSPRKSTPFAYYLGATPCSTTLASSHARDIVEPDAISALYADVDSTSPSSPSLSEFEFSSRFSEADTWFNPSSISPPMSTAEELFHNGKIRPLNPRLCYSSYCICFSDAAFDGDDYKDPHFDAYTVDDSLPPPHADQHHHQQQQHPSMLKQRLRQYTKTTSTLSALEQWKKSTGRYDRGHARHALGQQYVEKVMQISSLPLARYRNSRRVDGGHHRRARSLSPMRVFHMDEKLMQARASFESDMRTNTKMSQAVDGAGAITITRPRRSRKSWTLKELLNMGDNRVHDKRPQLIQGNGAPECAKSRSASSAFQLRTEEIEASLKSGKEYNVGKRSLEEERLHSKSSTQIEGARSPWNLQQAAQPQERSVADQYSCSIGSEEGQVHYKKGVLGCLGFTSKLNSIKGLQSCMP